MLFGISRGPPCKPLGAVPLSPSENAGATTKLVDRPCQGVRVEVFTRLVHPPFSRWLLRKKLHEQGKGLSSVVGHLLCMRKIPGSISTQIPIWNPGEPRPVSVDNGELDRPTVWFGIRQLPLSPFLGCLCQILDRKILGEGIVSYILKKPSSNLVTSRYCGLPTSTKDGAHGSCFPSIFISLLL